MSRKPETLRDAIKRRVAETATNPFRLANEIGGDVSHDQIRRYLNDDGDLTSAKVDALLRHLGLRVADG